MADYVPLLQSALWIATVLAVLWFFRRELESLRKAFRARLESGASVKLGAWLELGDLQQQLRDVRGQVGDLREKVAKLFLLTMSPSMYNKLRKLDSETFGPYVRSIGLESDLLHLRNLGYIEVPPVREVPERGHNLSDHVRVTPTGHDFVTLRESLTARDRI